MRRALHIGIFIGTLIGMSACASSETVDFGAHTIAEAARLA
jgi:hypothetical protein